MSAEIRLLLTFFLNVSIAVAELIGGAFSGSLALVSDAFHNISDAASSILSWLAERARRKPESERYTFGYRRAGVLAAAVNASVLVGMFLFLAYHALGRLMSPTFIKTDVMFWVAMVGLTANTTSVLLLHGPSKENINVRSTYLHLLSDAGSSAAVVLTSILMRFFQAFWLDPLLTLLIGAYIIKEAVKVVRKAFHILMEGAPEHIKPQEIIKALEGIEGVRGVHHLHLWCLGDNEVYATLHLDVEDGHLSQRQRIIDEAEKVMERLGVEHITVQLESGRGD